MVNYFNIFSEPNHEEKKICKPFIPVEYTIQSIIEKIESINQLNDSDIYSIIMRQHKMIFSYDLFLKNDESRKCAQKLFTNKRFLKILSDYIGLLQLSREEIICINKIAYDYYILQDKDPEINSLLMIISFQINNNVTIRLYPKLGVNGARVLSMIANSTFKDEKKVHRVNLFLIRCNLSLSVQDIVDIYCILFDRFTNLFMYTMFETKQPGMNNDQLKKFDMISQALLAMLDSLTSEDIKRVVYNYAYSMKLRNNYQVRFSLKSAKDYPRIVNIVNSIEFEDFEDLMIP